MQNRVAILLALAPLAAGLARADDLSVFDLGPLSPRMDRLSDAYVKNSAVCNAVAIPSANTGVPYRLFRLRVTGLAPITITAEPDASTPRFDPFLALHCSPNGLGTNNPTLDLVAADDDSGGYPKARLLSGVNLPNTLFIRDYFLFVSSYSARTDRRSGRVRLTVKGPATLIGCPGDLNSDDQVDDSDFTIFAKAYNILDCADPAMPAGCPADLNADGFVDDIDFQIFATAYDALLCS
ncbi:MAG: hypothetical protein K2Y21_10040 [Phycisphaerales bacterium]|nr:hypothetical protein [Phycisphaerales bacterium]